jgi:hypothetical protein
VAGLGLAALELGETFADGVFGHGCRLPVPASGPPRARGP